MSNYFLLQYPKNPKIGLNWRPGGTLRDFSSILSQMTEKLKGDTLGNFFEKKSRNAEKNWIGDPLVSPGIVCYAEKERNLSGSVP